MSETEIRDETANAEKRTTRRDVCLACDQCIRRPSMPLACALVVNPNRDFEPCAAKLARMQTHPHAQCPHPDPSQRAKWSAAELHVLGSPVHARSATQSSRPTPPKAVVAVTQPVGPRRIPDGAPPMGRAHTAQRGSPLNCATPVYAPRARRNDGLRRTVRKTIIIQPSSPVRLSTLVQLHKAGRNTRLP